MFNRAVIVGCGSIGSSHAKSLSKISQEVHIVDPKFVNTNILDFEFSATSIVSNLSELKFSPEIMDIVVISNWGPDHWETINHAANLGFTRFVLEKPMTSSMTDLLSLKTLVIEKKLDVVVNQGWASEKLGLRIVRIGEEMGLGAPVAIWVNGGARCISTAGSHVIHLASTIFGGQPDSVFGFGESDPINPRDSKLSYFDGTYSVKFRDNCSLGINYTNRSSISGNIEIYWKEARAQLVDSAQIEISRRPTNREYKDIITRYGPADDEIFSGKLPLLVGQAEISPATLYMKLIEEDSDSLRLEFLDHLISNEILLRLLISSTLGRQISMDERFSEEVLAIDFRIS